METQTERQPWENGGRLGTMWPLGGAYQGGQQVTSKDGNFREELYGYPDLPSISEVTSLADDYTVCFLAFSKPLGDLGTPDLLHSSYRELEKLRNKRQQHLRSHAGRAERQIQPDDKPPLKSDSVMFPNRTIQGRGQHRESATKATTESTSPGTSGKLPGTYPFSHPLHLPCQSHRMGKGGRK